jgi:hypothetical protein
MARKEKGLDLQLGTWYELNVAGILSAPANCCPGITPFVNPEDLKFFFQEVHRLTA